MTAGEPSLGYTYSTGKPGIHQRLCPRRGGHRDHDLAGLIHLVSFEQIEGDHVGGDILHRREARFHVGFAAAVGAREHDQTKYAPGVVHRRKGQQAVVSGAVQVVPRCRRGPAVFREVFGVVGNAAGQQAEADGPVVLDSVRCRSGRPSADPRPCRKAQARSHDTSDRHR